MIKCNENTHKKTDRDSKSKLNKETKNREDCVCYYRFKVDNDRFKLVTFEETHSHELSIKVDTLTEAVVIFQNFRKSATPIDFLRNQQNN